ncbi:MAG: hypothetical protein M3305_02650 [Actinomycetota bacterium]|nr:hypothetical protein [Actinomycetota bacterium]
MINIFLERRARLLLRRKSCQKVESAREAQQRVIVAIEGSGDSTKLLLDGRDCETLLRGRECLVAVGERRERVAEEVRDLKGTEYYAARNDGSIALLEDALHAMDTELYDPTEMLSALRTRIIRSSTESRDAAGESAVTLSADLDELNLRLEVLHQPKKLFPNQADSAPGHLQHDG